MKQRLSTSDKDDDGPAKKKTKTDDNSRQQNGNQNSQSVFTSLEFKNLVKEPGTRLQALKKFSKSCENFNAKIEGAVDIVKSYISSSPDCIEIFKCFNAHNSSNEIGSIFRSLLCILTRTAGNLKELYEKVGFDVCGCIMQSHLQKIYQGLGMQHSPRTVTTALKLLTIMVMQGKETAWEIVNNTDFSLKCFKEILNKNKGKQGKDTRLTYIRFVLSFFMCDDAKIVQKVLETQGLISIMLKELKNDSASVVQLVLTTLREKAIKNLFVSKTAKTRFFAEPMVLKYLADLFEWDGVPDVALEGVHESARDYIRQLVFNFLYHACCPFKYGINFKDATLGTGEKSKNHILLDFGFHLLPLSSDALVRNLLVEILRACPDLLPRFMGSFMVSLEPKIADIWLRNYELVKQTYEAQPDVATALTQLLSSRHVSSEQEMKLATNTLVQMTIPGIFPPNFTSLQVLKHCLRSEVTEIRLKALSLMFLFLQKAKASLGFASRHVNWPRVGYSAEESELFVSELQDTLLKNYVSINLIISAWKESCKNNMQQLKNLTLKNLCVLQEMFPDAIKESNFDFTKLLFGMAPCPQTECELIQQDHSDVLVKMLAKSSHLFKWFKIVDNGQSSFRRLLQIIYECKSTRHVLYQNAVLLFQNILICNKVLSSENSSEAKVWIDKLPLEVKTHNDYVILDFLSNICGAIVRKPVQYSDLRALESEHGRGAPKVGKDFWESLSDVEIETVSSEELHTLECKSYGSFTPLETADKTYAMSLMSVATLDELNTCDLLGNETDVLENYLASVLLSILCALPGEEEAKLFAQIFASIVENIPQFEVKFPHLQNVFGFLSLWDDRNLASYKPRLGEDMTVYMQNWIWHVHKKNIHGGDLFQNFTSKFESNALCDIEHLLCQSLLFFDTISNHERPQKELLCVIASLLLKLPGGMHVENAGPVGAENPRTPTLLPWKRFLGNRSVQGLFLYNIHTEHMDIHQSLKTGNLYDGSGKLDSICTSISAQILKLCYLNSCSPVDSCFKFYVSRIAQALPQLLKDIADSKTQILPDCNYAVLQIFGDLCSVLHQPMLQGVLDHVAGLLGKVCSKNVAKLGCLLLCQSIKCLLVNNFCEIKHQSMKRIFDFLSSKFCKNSDELRELVAQLVARVPSLAVVADVTLIRNCTKKPSPGGAILAAKLVQCNPTLLLDWDALSVISSMTFEDGVTLLPLLNQLLKMSLKCFQGNSAICRKAMKAIVDSFMPIMLSNPKVSQILDCEGGKEFVKSFILSVVKCGETDYVTSLVDSLSQEGADSCPDWLLNLVEVILSLCDHSQNSLLSNFRMVAISSLMQAVVQHKSNFSINIDRVFTTLQDALQKLKECNQEEACRRISEKWSKFLKVALKYYFENTAALQCLLEMVSLVYGEDGAFKCAMKSKEDSMITAVVFRHMLVSHSKFLPTVLVAEGATKVENLSCVKNVKDILLELLFEVTLRCETSALLENDLSFLLGGYGGTFSFSDQNILKTIVAYERKGVNFKNMKPFLWGQTAVSSYKARRNLGETLWKKPGPSDVLACLDSRIMDATLTRFPLRRRMTYIDLGMVAKPHFENDLILTISAANNEVQHSRRPTQEVYDPAFLVPIIFQVLLPENLVDCRLLTRSGVLSFLMACLASHCPSVRSMAACCLDMYYQHTQTAWFSENNLTMYLIRCVRNSIEPKIVEDDGMVIPRLSSVVANFFATVARLHLTPEDHMFSVLHRFLLVKPQFDLKNIPEFYVLFFSAEMENKIERTWILNLIAGGLRDMGDYHVIKRRNVFQLLMCLHDSPISDNFVRRQIFQIFEQACAIRSAAIDLVKNHGLVPWLTQAISQQSCNTGMLNVAHSVGSPGRRQGNTRHIVRVMSTLWNSLNMNDFIADDIAEVHENRENPDEESCPGKHASLAPFRVVKQLVRLSIASLDSLLCSNKQGSEILQTDILQFFNEALTVLNSCLVNLEKRRKLDAIRKDDSDSLEDSCDLLTQDIQILLQCAELLSNCGNEKSATCQITVLTFWYPQSVATDDEFLLWKLCLEWAVGNAFLLWSQNTKWIQSNFLNFLKWVGKWTSFSVGSLEKQHKKAIDKCCSVACCNSSILGDQFLKCLVVLSEILAEIDGKSCHQDEETTVLRDMHRIRTSIHLESV